MHYLFSSSIHKSQFIQLKKKKTQKTTTTKNTLKNNPEAEIFGVGKLCLLIQLPLPREQCRETDLIVSK